MFLCKIHEEIHLLVEAFRINFRQAYVFKLIFQSEDNHQTEYPAAILTILMITMIITTTSLIIWVPILTILRPLLTILTTILTF